MKSRVAICLCLASLLIASFADAQTLTEKLIAENSATLAEAARRDGNLVRGAILFHQGNINCAKCHRPQAEANRIGPDLSRIDPATTDSLIVESVLQPSKSIKQGFETITALTFDGQVFSGMIVSQTENQVVLRNNQNVDQLITLAKNDIEEMRPGTTSSMPDDLVNQLSSRQQFLDLIRYVIDIRERGPVEEIAGAVEPSRRALSQELTGAILFQDMNCAACHQADLDLTGIPANQAPNLNWSAKWLSPDYLARFIANPHETKPGTRMPQVMAQLEPEQRAQIATAISHFLTDRAGNQFQNQPVDAEAVVRGAELFHASGCVACHAPRDANANEQPFADSVPLGSLNGKYSSAGLVAFLESPHDVRPSGRMPNMNLTHPQAQDIANFLLQDSEPTEVNWQVDAALAKAGRQHFLDLNCAACHRDVLEPPAALVRQLVLDPLKLDQGCLSAQSGNWPDFGIDNQDRELIRAAITRLPDPLNDQQRIDVSLTAFRCTVCHQRNDLGGVTDLRNPYFQTTNLNLGDQGRIPPTLTGVGAKLNAKWMRDVLVNQRVIRPYMKTQMPQFGEANIGHLVSLFQNADHLSDTAMAEVDDAKAMRKQGLLMAGNQGLNCVACHTYQYKLSDTMPAVDLTEMAERLKKDWFYQYMLAPQHFSPNTVMPSFWPGGVAIRKDIEGDPAYQIESLWQYLLEGRQAGTPSGVVRKPLEIVVTNEAQMLRRSYPGIGKRGIGVGYPGGVNLAFDAEQMRLATLWRGKFVDPAGVWTGQGHGNVRPLGRSVEFAKGPNLDDGTRPWQVDDSRPPSHHFEGYQLDELRRPSFRYRFENVEAHDFFAEVEVPDQPTRLRRTITLSSDENHDNLTFRIASGESPVKQDDGWVAVDPVLRVRVVSDQQLQIVEAGEQQQLQVPISLKAGQSVQLIVDYLW